jgi:UDP-N-acetyl-D-mannosaminuronic acid dehydrogenase
VGAPLAILLASRGFDTVIYDVNPAAIECLASGKMPFLEGDAEELLEKALQAGMLSFTSQAADIDRVSYVILTIGTPIDEFHNPMLRVIRDCIDDLVPHLKDGQTLILRSTVFPGVTDYVQQYLERQGKRILVAFCPERVVQGQAIRELQDLPQIVAGTTAEAEESADRLFSSFAPKIVRMVPKEAEFAKLFCNAYRYIQFAATNQFYMLVEAAGLDYHRLLEALKEDYPRMRDLPGPGLAAGPCLYKDTLQLTAFTNNQFTLAHAALQINEELPAFLVRQLAAQYPLSDMTVGLLGMAFKADSDDIRASLSYKLKKLLQLQTRRVLTTDPLVREDPDLLPLEQVLTESDVLVLCAPHAEYRQLDLRGKPVLDVWNLLAKSHTTGNPGLSLGAAVGR